MKKILVKAVGCAVFLWIVTGLLLVGANQKYTTRQQAKTQLHSQLYSQFSLLNKICSGVAAASADPYSGQVTMIAIKDAGSSSWAKVHFKTTSGLTNKGSTPWTNVTVTVTVEVLSTSRWQLLIGAAVNNSNYGDSYTAMENGGIQNAGTVSVTSKPFTIYPGAEYRGVALLYFGVHAEDAQWVRARVKSIKFNL